MKIKKSYNIEAEIINGINSIEHLKKYHKDIWDIVGNLPRHQKDGNGYSNILSFSHGTDLLNFLILVKQLLQKFSDYSTKK